MSDKRYRIKEGLKHWVGGQQYFGKNATRQTGDVLVLSDERAAGIMDKLEPLDGPPGDIVEEAPPSVEVEEEKVDNSLAEVEEKKEDKEEGKIKDSSLVLRKEHIGEGKWDVFRGEEKINDVSLTNQQADDLIRNKVY